MPPNNRNLGTARQPNKETPGNTGGEFTFATGSLKCSPDLGRRLRRVQLLALLLQPAISQLIQFNRQPVPQRAFRTQLGEQFFRFLERLLVDVALAEQSAETAIDLLFGKQNSNLVAGKTEGRLFPCARAPGIFLTGMITWWRARGYTAIGNSPTTPSEEAPGDICRAAVFETVSAGVAEFWQASRRERVRAAFRAVVCASAALRLGLNAYLRLPAPVRPRKPAAQD